MSHALITYGYIALTLAIIAMLASSIYSYSLSIPNTVGNYGSTTLSTYYIDVEANNSGKIEAIPGAKVCMSVSIPNGPGTNRFCSITDSNGRAILLINMRSNYTQLLSGANLNTEPALLAVDIYTTFTTVDNYYEEHLRFLIPVQYVLNGFYLKENLGNDICSYSYCITDDVVYLDNVRLLYNDVREVFVMPSNTTLPKTSTATLLNVTTLTSTRTVTSTVTSFITKTVSGIRTRTEYITTTVTAAPVTSYVTRTVTSTSFLTLISTRTVSETRTAFRTKTVTSASTLWRTLSFTRSVTLTTTVPVTLVNTSTVTVTKTLTGGAGLSRGPSTVAIVLSILIVAASIIVLALSRR